MKYGSGQNGPVSEFTALSVALFPLLQNYVGIYKNAAVSLLILIFPFMILRTLRKMSAGAISKRCVTAVIPLIFFELYTAVVHSISLYRLMYSVFLILVFLSLSSGSINSASFFKYALFIIEAAFAVMIIQQVIYLGIQKKLDIRLLSLLADQDSIWIKHAESGASFGFYRTAGFFLEPSHLFLYSFPVLTMLLLQPDMNAWRMKHAVIVTAAMLLSTSGMGVVAAVGIWIVYFTVCRRNKTGKIDLFRLISWKSVFIGVIFLLVFIAAYFTVPIFQKTVTRIFYNSEGPNAIQGRVRRAINYVRGINGSAVLFGESGVVGELDFHLAGFFLTYIKWGVCGLVLSYWFYVQGLFCLKNACFWLTVIILGLSFFTAHTHGTFYMIYFILFLMQGYSEVSGRKLENVSKEN